MLMPFIARYGRQYHAFRSHVCDFRSDIATTVAGTPPAD